MTTPRTPGRPAPPTSPARRADLLRILAAEPLALSVVDDEDGRIVFSDIPERLVPSLKEQFGAPFEAMLAPSAEEAAWVDAVPEVAPAPPKFVALFKSGALAARVKAIKQPQAKAVYFSAAINAGDESILGRTGVMYFVCKKGCHFCQYHGFEEHSLTVDEAAERMLAFQEAGADNVQWLSPQAYTRFLVAALLRAAEQGFSLPIVHKSEGEESLEELALLDGLVDVYLPDAKFIREETAAKIGLLQSYPARMRKAIAEMHRQTGPLVRRRGTRVVQSGMLVRHLVMPGGVDEAGLVLDFLRTLGGVAVDVMTSYRPLHEAAKVAEIARNPSEDEIAAVVAAARRGLHVLVR